MSFTLALVRYLNLDATYCPPRRLPDAGGAVKVQIYSPYVIVNKTGLPFSVKSVRSNRAGPPQDVAGETPSGRILVDFWGLEFR